MKQITIKFLSIFPKKLSKRLANVFSRIFKAVGTDDVKIYCNWKNTETQSVGFIFNGQYAIAHKSYAFGQENVLLRNSISLLKNKSDIVIIDIGANYGFLSLAWVQCLKPNVKVYSLEAHPNAYKNMHQSIIDNNIQNSMSAYNYAVGQNNGELEMYIRNTSLNKNPESQNSKDKIKVPMICIDSFVKNENLKKIDLIKIDVDGMEYEILEGAHETIKMFRPDMIIETNNDIRIMNLVKEWGYYLYNLNLSRVKDGEIPENVVCLAKELVNK